MQTDENDQLSPTEARALTGLMTARTIEEAARRAGVSERTLRRWLDRDDFRQALRFERRAVMQHTTTRLQQASVCAVDTLIAVMDDKQSSSAARVAAARAVLDLAREGIDIDFILERLDALERESKSGMRSSGQEQ